MSYWEKSQKLIDDHFDSIEESLPNCTNEVVESIFNLRKQISESWLLGKLSVKNMQSNELERFPKLVERFNKECICSSKHDHEKLLGKDENTL